MTAAAVPVPVNVVARAHPVNGHLEVRLRAATSLDQCDTRGCVRNKDVTQAIAAVATKLKNQVSDIGDKTGSGTQLHDIGVHSSIIATAGYHFPTRANRVGRWDLEPSSRFPTSVARFAHGQGFADRVTRAIATPIS
jgi:hypothetical protein